MKKIIVAVKEFVDDHPFELSMIGSICTSIGAMIWAVRFTKRMVREICNAITSLKA